MKMRTFKITLAITMFISLFIASSADAQWNSNGNHLYYNPNGGRVGIGTNSPSQKLEVNGTIQSRRLYLKPHTNNAWHVVPGGEGGRDLLFQSSHSNQPINTRLYLKQNGKIGINTTSDLSAQLNVQATGMQLRLSNSNAGGATWNIGASSNNWNVGGGKFIIAKPGSSSEAALVINSNNSVGIGTPTPNSAYRLSVNGKIRAKEIVVESGWADFVFEDDYPLMPLEEVEAYIQAHQHLPEIPSAQEVEEKGVSVGEMESKLIAKNRRTHAVSY